MHRIYDCWDGIDLRCGLAGEAWTGYLVTTYISGTLIEFGGKTNERVVRRQREWGWWEVVKIYPRKAAYLSLILFRPFCIARSGMRLTAYATTFCQIIYNAFHIQTFACSDKDGSYSARPCGGSKQSKADLLE